MKSYLIIFFLFFNLLKYNAQFQNRFVNSNPAAGTYYDILNKANVYFTANPDTSRDGAFSEFNRWSNFWETRVGVADPNSNGTFLPAAKALNSLMQNPICSTGPYANSWINLGPGISPENDQAIGIVYSVAFDPINPLTTFYAGTTNSGLWKTTNSGQSWTCLTESLRLPGLGIPDIAINPNNNLEIYIATGVVRLGSYGLGVLKTTDGGQTWSSTGLAFNPANPNNSFVTNRVLINPLNPQVVYALVQDKLFKTIDGGTNWSSIFQLQSSKVFPANSISCIDPWSCSTLTRNLIDIEMKPGDPNTIYISSDDTPNSAITCANTCGVPSLNTSNGGAELWKSTDGGATWTELTNVTTNNPLSTLYASNNNITLSSRLEIAVTPADPNSIFINYGHQNNAIPAYTQKSTDGGVTWNLPIIAPVFFAFNVSPTDPLKYYSGNLTTSRSINGGLSWSTISDYYSTTNNFGGHGDVRAMTIVNNAGNDALLMGNDGGICFIANGNPPWLNVSKTLPITQFYGLAGSEKNSNLIIGGTQDNGVYTYNNGNWSYQIVGDAYDCAFDYSNPNISYAEANGGSNSLVKSLNSGASWGIFAQPTGNSRLVRPIENNSTNNNIYIGYQDVFKQHSDNSFSPNWIKLSDFSTNFNVSNLLTAIAVAPSNSNVIYSSFFGSCGGCSNPSNFLFRTTVGGGLNASDWQDITAGTGIFIWNSVSSIAVNPTKENELWVTVSGFAQAGQIRVLHSSDYGTTWNDYSTNLPEFPANKIVYEKGSNDGLYVATDVGVFYRNKSMAQWECFNSNLPVCIVTDLEINYASNTIRAATFGRGIWASSLVCPTNINLTDNTTYNNATSFFELKNDITSNATVNNGSSLIYRAGNQIDLKPGFDANANSSNSYFQAFIHNCDISGNSFRTNPSNNVNPNIDSNLSSIETNKNKSEKKRMPYEFSVMPNPNNGEFNLILDESMTLPNNIAIVDLLGKQVLAITNPNSYRYDFNLGNIPKGMFIIKVSYSDRIMTKRLIKD